MKRTLKPKIEKNPIFAHWLAEWVDENQKVGTDIERRARQKIRTGTKAPKHLASKQVSRS